jgi:hypothetical protein
MVQAALTRSCLASFQKIVTANRIKAVRRGEKLIWLGAQRFL